MAVHEETVSEPLLTDQSSLLPTEWNTCSLDGNSFKSKEQKKAVKKLTAAIVLCFLFMIVELIGGWFASSLAIMSDAAHLLSDVAGFAVSLMALHITQMKSPTMTYGYARAEVLGALLSVVTIWMVTGMLVLEAIQRILHPQDVDGKLMFIIASIGVVVNLSLFVVLGEEGHSHGLGGHDHDHDHGHHHGHSHGPSNGHGHSHGSHDDAEEGHAHDHSSSGSHEHHGDDDHDPHHEHVHDSEGQSGGNMNVRSAWLHAIGDLLQSIGVMIAAALIWWKPEWRIADPIATLLFSVLVIWTTKSLISDIIDILMQRVPGGLDPAVVASELSKVEGVARVHDLHLWSLTSGVPILSVHIDVLPGFDCNQITGRVSKTLREKGITHVTVQTH